MAENYHRTYVIERLKRKIDGLISSSALSGIVAKTVFEFLEENGYLKPIDPAPEDEIGASVLTGFYNRLSRLEHRCACLEDEQSSSKRNYDEMKMALETTIEGTLKMMGMIEQLVKDRISELEAVESEKSEQLVSDSLAGLA